MKPVEISRTVAATAQAVFDVVANGRNYGRAIPEIDTVEFLTENETGVGAQFRETRHFSGIQALFAKVFGLSATKSEVTDFEDGRMVRLLTEEAGALWHTTFTVTPNESDDEARLDMHVRIEPISLMGKLVTPFIRPAAVKGITADVEAVKAYVEAGSPVD
ncbi:MAG: SRPBCC family protein [Rhodobacteraceae bacterium]|nr:SRPBCC family protein [Paracoccaceae bacterium]